MALHERVENGEARVGPRKRVREVHRTLLQVIGDLERAFGA